MVNSYVFLLRFPGELDDTPGVPSMTNCPQETKRKVTKLSSKHQNVSKTDELSTRPQPPCSVRLIDEEERVLVSEFLIPKIYCIIKLVTHSFSASSYGKVS